MGYFCSTQGLILFCPLTYPKDAIDLKFDKNFQGAIHAIDSLAYLSIREFSGDLLIIAAKKDQIVSPDIINGYLENAQNVRSKRILWLDNCDHYIHRWLPHQEVLKNDVLFGIQQTISACGVICSSNLLQGVLEFFNHAKVPLYEGYGLNETCIVAKNYPGSFRLGSVGKVVPNKTIRFDKDGVLIVGSRYPVNHQYLWCAPGVNEKIFLPTAEVKTYDLGHVDEDGFLYIHGRLDDVLTLDNGRNNVLVRLIEEKLREHPDVHECVLFGNGKPFLTAVISPHSNNIFSSSLDDYIKTLNETFLPEQRIHALVFAVEKFSIENGLLTSQFKPLRKNIFNRYMAELARVYEAPGGTP